MIYVIKTSYYNYEENRAFPLMKIGYTNENGLERRLAQYGLHNPLFDLLYTFPGMTIDDERRLHNYFRGYRFYTSYGGNEWFLYDASWADKLFDTLTLESVAKLPLDGVWKTAESLDIKRKIEELVDKVLSWTIDIPEENDMLKRNSMVKKIQTLNPQTTEDVAKFVNAEFGKDVLSEIDNFTVLPETTEFMKKFLEGKCSFPGRIRVLAKEFPSLPEESKPEVLRLIPFEHKFFLLLLKQGQTEIKGCLDRHIKAAHDALYPTTSKLCSEAKLRRAIYLVFQVGQKITLSEAETKLGKIYSSISYSSHPKAIDLEKYFEVRQILISVVIDGIKKREKGYELLKKRGNRILIDQLVSAIYSEFKEGDQYTLSDLKDKVAKIYDEISYEATPRAIDILEFFEVREFLTTIHLYDGTKKRVKAYKLLKKKLSEGSGFPMDQLRNAVYSEFKEGDIVMQKGLKERLGKIYKSVSYSATPKVQDITNFFEVREFKTSEYAADGTRKRERYFELLKKRPQK